LARFDTGELTELIDSRPDLGYPLPRHCTDLAAAATATSSVRRAIDGLNAWQVAVLKALAVLPDVTDLAGVTQLLGSAEEPVSEGVTQLRRLALVWGDDQHIHLVRAVRDQFGSYPAGLAPPSPHPLTVDEIDAAITASGPDVVPIVQRLTWGPPTGSVSGADRRVSIAEARTPVEKLLARRLLRPLDRDTVVLPQEVALRLRSRESDWLLDGEPVSPAPPQPWGRVRAERTSTLAAVGAAHEVSHDLEHLIAAIDADPPRLLRDGALAIRDLQTLSRHVGGDTDYAGFLIECAAAAGLINNHDRPDLLPTPDWDRWLTLDAPDRWQAIVRAWHNTRRWFGTPGSDPRTGHDHRRNSQNDPDPAQISDQASSRPRRARPLAADDHAPQAARLRTVIIRLAAAAEIGSVPQMDSLTAVVGWQLPAAAGSPERLRQLVELTWHQAGWLGLVALDGTTRLLPVAADDSDLPDDLRRLFPQPVQDVIIQSDLTAVAQGPLESGVAGVLRLLADQESHGGGAVFRFNQASLRRGFDAGWSGAEITDWLQTHSTTGVPQPLSYLIGDVARQHGAVRVGGVSSYVRIEDPAQQAAVTSHPDAAALNLRAIAPGVLVSPAEPDEVIGLLRRLGLHPAAEDEQQQLLTARPRRRARRAHRGPDEQPRGDPRQVAEAILAAEHRLPPAADVGETVQRLRDAAARGQAVRVSVVDRDGQATEHSMVPLSVTDGTLRARQTESTREWSMPVWQLRIVDDQTGQTG
jgi:hypothetical protein